MNEIIINKDIIKNNIKTFKNKSKKQIIYVLKANAYGLGIIEMARFLNSIEENAYFAVGRIEEYLELKKNKINNQIICFKEIDLNDWNKEFNNLEITINNLEYYKENIKIINNYKIKYNIKINTGMNRNGLKPEEFKQVNQDDKNLIGIFSHISDSENEKRTKKQIEIFEDLTKDLKVKNKHILSSTSAINYHSKFSNYIRLGIGPSGFYINNNNIKNAIKVKSNIVKIIDLKKNEYIGYTSSYQVKKDCKIAIIPVGYGDGISRLFNKMSVLINKKEYKIIGNICMDYLFVEIDDEVKLNDDVYFYTNLEKNQKQTKTSSYELITNLNGRWTRIFK